MRTLKLTIQYDGTDFVGWQRQAHGTSIQGLLEDALARIEDRPVAVAGAGRTDAGVHAAGQVASIVLAHPLATDALLRALNAMLPAAIRVIQVQEAPSGFHARFHARAKTYRYRILDSPIGSPFERHYAWHVPHPLDLAAMQRVIRVLPGVHDFAAFQAAGGTAATTVRTIFGATVGRVPSAHDDEAGVIVFEITGDGFLRHMVRGLAGTIVEVGSGRRPIDTLATLLETAPRTAIGPTAPALGLCLMRVDYPAGSLEAHPKSL